MSAERTFEAALRRIASFDSRYGPGDEALIARAALAGKAPQSVTDYTVRARRVLYARLAKLQPAKPGTVLEEVYGDVLGEFVETVAAELQAVAGEDTAPLFVSGDFKLHSGLRSTWKIDCDALTDADWATLAAMAAPLLQPFKEVEAIPRGGVRFAAALRPYAKPDASLLLLADDVLTTGESMERARAGGGKVIGVVAFARGPWSEWVTPLFVARQVTDAEARINALEVVLRDAHAHIEELRGAWERGAISEHDGKGGLRSNRNADVERQLRTAIKR